MIQRIQTIFLLLVTVAITFTMFLPIITLRLGGNYIELAGHGGISRIFDGITETIVIYSPLAIGLIVIALIAFVTIFLWKNRKLQVTLTIVNLVLTIAYCAFIGCQVWDLIQNYPMLQPTIGLGAFLPAVAIIFDILAIVFIRKDENLVRASDRLR